MTASQPWPGRTGNCDYCPGAILKPMAAVDLDHPPEGIVILAEPKGTMGQLDPRAWVAAVRRSAPRHLQQAVAEHLSATRELGEV